MGSKVGDIFNAPIEPLPPEDVRPMMDIRIMFANDFALVEESEHLRKLVLEAHFSNVHGDIKYLASRPRSVVSLAMEPRTINNEFRFIRLVVKTDEEKVAYEVLRTSARKAWNTCSLDYYTQIHHLPRKWPHVKYLDL